MSDVKKLLEKSSWTGREPQPILEKERLQAMVDGIADRLPGRKVRQGSADPG